jgi:hypothetical protein
LKWQGVQTGSANTGTLQKLPSSIGQVGATVHVIPVLLLNAVPLLMHCKVRRY